MAIAEKPAIERELIGFGTCGDEVETTVAVEIPERGRVTGLPRCQVDDGRRREPAAVAGAQQAAARAEDVAEELVHLPAHALEVGEGVAVAAHASDDTAASSDVEDGGAVPARDRGGLRGHGDDVHRAALRDRALAVHRHLRGDAVPRRRQRVLGAADRVQQRPLLPHRASHHPGSLLAR